MSAPLDRERLAKVLGLLGSRHDGEVVTAARHADTIVKRAGLTWHDVVLRPPLLTPRPDPVPFGDIGEITYCLRHQRWLNDWDRNFLTSVRRWHGPLTPKQRNTLARIVDKLRARPEAA